MSDKTQCCVKIDLPAGVYSLAENRVVPASALVQAAPEDGLHVGQVGGVVHHVDGALLVPPGGVVGEDGAALAKSERHFLSQDLHKIPTLCLDILSYFQTIFLSS